MLFLRKVFRCTYPGKQASIPYLLSSPEDLMEVAREIVVMGEQVIALQTDVAVLNAMQYPAN
jgi:hypothetical protein